MKSLHSREVLWTCPGSSLPAEIPLPGLGCLISIQIHPHPPTKHKNGQGSSCFRDGETTEDASNKQTDQKYM